MANKRTFQEHAAVFNGLSSKIGTSNNKNVLIWKARKFNKDLQKFDKFYESPGQVLIIVNLCILYHLNLPLFLFL